MPKIFGERPLEEWSLLPGVPDTVVESPPHLLWPTTDSWLFARCSGYPRAVDGIGRTVQEITDARHGHTMCGPRLLLGGKVFG